MGSNVIPSGNNIVSQLFLVVTCGADVNIGGVKDQLAFLAFVFRQNFMKGIVSSQVPVKLFFSCLLK